MASTPPVAGFPASAADRAALDAAAAIADSVVRPAAPDVDRDGRFPAETFSALREAGLLRALIPQSHGGPGCSAACIATICTLLARACGSSGLIFAMHQIQVACLIRHANSERMRSYLRELVETSPLLASATSEVGTHGDLRTSIAAVEPGTDGLRLRKRCPAISYGAHADALLVTARRAPDAASGDQVLVLLRRGDYRLEQVGEWDTLGMRGTCSPAFSLEASFAEEQIVPAAFRDIAAQTMVPYSHLFWAGAWLGIASEAVAVAGALYRKTARDSPQGADLGSRPLGEALAKLETLRARVNDAAAALERISEPAVAAGIGAMIRTNTLKLEASELACAICLDCLHSTGLRGYTDHGPTALGRQLRDVLSAPLMISNERIAASNRALLQIHAPDP